MKSLFRSAGVLLAAGVLLSGCKDQKKIQDTSINEEDTIMMTEVPEYIAEGIRKAIIYKAGEEVLNISYEPAEEEASYKYWKMYAPYGEETIIDTEGMLNFYQLLEALELKPQAENQEQAVSLQNVKDKITLEFCQKTDKEEDSYKAQADKSCTILLGDEDGKGYRLATVEGNEEQVYLVEAAAADEILNVNAFDMVLKVSALADVETVKEVQIEMDGEQYSIDSHHDLYAELLSVMTIGENEQQGGDGSLMLALQFIRNDKKEEDLKIEYYEYDEGRAAVKVNGREDFLVSRSDVEKLKESIFKEVRNL